MSIFVLFLFQFLILISNSNHILFLDFLLCFFYINSIFIFMVIQIDFQCFFFLVAKIRVRENIYYIYILQNPFSVLYFFLHETSICMIKYSHHKILSILNVWFFWPFGNIWNVFSKKKKKQKKISACKSSSYHLNIYSYYNMQSMVSHLQNKINSTRNESLMKLILIKCRFFLALICK